MHQASPANIKRRRQATRRVVDDDSSLVESLTDEEQQLRFTEVDENHEGQGLESGHGSIETLSIDEADPQVDWRTTQYQCGLAEDDDEDDLEVQTQALEMCPYQVPDSVKIAEATFHRSIYLNRIDQKYADFLTRLCRKTATEYMEAYILEGLAFAVSKAESIPLHEELMGETNLYAFALIVYIWQVVGLQTCHGSFPRKDDALPDHWACHFLSAHTIVNDAFGSRDISVARLRFAVKYWESRLFVKGGNDIWVNAQWLRSVNGPIYQTPKPRNAMAEEYLRILGSEGKLGLALYVLNKESEGPTTPLRTHLDPNQPEEKKWAVSEIFAIFNSMNTEVLRALIEGQLARKAEIYFEEVWANLEHINDPRKVRPSIYQNCICDRKGISPTPVQWLTVCEKMHAYTESGSSDLAAAVDQLIHPSRRWPKELAYKNLRRYTEWRSWLNNEDEYPNDNHRRMVRYFVSEVRKRVSKEAEHVPLTAPVIEIGYSVNSHDRLRQHARHRNSNYLMNLSEAMFEYCYPGSFRLQQRIIYNCYSEEQTWLGEIVLTQLGQGYTEGGGGFSHHPAGNSNGSAYRSTSAKDWDRYAAEVANDERIEAELNREVEWAEERRKAQTEGFEMEKARLLSFRDLVDAATRLGNFG